MSTTGTYTLPHNEGKYKVLAPLVITSKPFEYVQGGDKAYSSYASFSAEVC